MVDDVKRQRRAAEVAWLKLSVAADAHADALVTSFETDDRWLSLKEGHKLLHSLNLRDAILAWAKEGCRLIHGGGPKTIGGKIIHPPPLDDDGLDRLDIPTVCRRSGLGRSYVYEAIRRGELPARKYGRLTRVLIDDYLSVAR